MTLRFLSRCRRLFFLFTLFLIELVHPFSAGSYPTVSSHTGEWSLEPNSHSLAWSTPLVSADSGEILISVVPPSTGSTVGIESTRTGSLMFTVAGDDPETFFPVRVAFVGQVRGTPAASVFCHLLTSWSREASPVSV